MTRKSRRGKRKTPAPVPAARPTPPTPRWEALLARLPWPTRKSDRSATTREEALRAVPYRNPQLRWEEREPDRATGHPVPVVVLLIPRRQDGWHGLLNRFVTGPEYREVILDELGTDVWRLCDGVASVELIIQALAERHRLGRREVELSLTEYLRILARRGFIRLQAPNAGPGGTENIMSGPGRERLVGGAGQRQVQLPLRKAFAIALQSIRVRFWRSMITAAGVLLGIAFLGSTFTQAILAERTPAPSGQGLSARSLQAQQQEERARQVWLVSMSLVVCAVGIANAMLMSVTERFKEIGTMKCLGALDSFIVKLFLLEAGVLGVLASLAGFLLGFTGTVLVALAQNGWIVFQRLPPDAVLRSFLWSMLAGTVLTVLATIFPAIQAARLPPAAALRSEI